MMRSLLSVALATVLVGACAPTRRRVEGSEGAFAPFDVTILHRVEEDQRGALIVATPGRQNVREYPIWLDGS